MQTTQKASIAPVRTLFVVAVTFPFSRTMQCRNLERIRLQIRVATSKKIQGKHTTKHHDTHHSRVVSSLLTFYSRSVRDDGMKCNIDAYQCYPAAVW